MWAIHSDNKQIPQWRSSKSKRKRLHNAQDTKCAQSPYSKQSKVPPRSAAPLTSALPCLILAMTSCAVVNLHKEFTTHATLAPETHNKANVQVQAKQDATSDELTQHRTTFAALHAEFDPAYFLQHHADGSGTNTSWSLAT